MRDASSARSSACTVDAPLPTWTHRQLPELLQGRAAHHLKRCHLANADAIYQAEVLPEIAPELVEETH